MTRRMGAPTRVVRQRYPGGDGPLDLRTGGHYRGRYYDPCLVHECLPASHIIQPLLPLNHRKLPRRYIRTAVVRFRRVEGSRR